MTKAAIRINKITSIAQLRGATLHAERHDETGKARVREGAVAGEALAWAKAENDRDYLTAFKTHKTEAGAKERKGAPIAMQVLCVVSPEWVVQVGDLHDRNNPRNQQLFEHAKAWAESWAGEGSVFGVRLDLDEAGGAVVDLMIAPVRESRGKPVISTQKALTELKTAMGERNEYSALQTSWADHCRAHLDPSIERGTRKEITKREHVSPEVYGAVKDKVTADLQATSRARLEGDRSIQDRLVDEMENLPLDKDDTDTLRDYLLLRGELIEHRTNPTAYEPPRGAIGLESAVEATAGPKTTLEALRSGATAVLEAAQRFGMGFAETFGKKDYLAGADWFPVLADRLHLSAVIAKCAAFSAQMEGVIKLMQHGADPKTYAKPTPQDASVQAVVNAKDEVTRHETALGLHPVARPVAAEKPAAMPKLSMDWLATQKDWTEADRKTCKRLFDERMTPVEIAALKKGDVAAVTFLQTLTPDPKLRGELAIQYLKADPSPANTEIILKLALEQADTTAREQDDGFGHD